MAQEDGAEAAAAVGVGDGQADLGPVGVHPKVRGDPDHLLLGAGGGYQRKRIDIIYVAVPAGGGLQVYGRGEKSKGPGLEGQGAVKLQEGRLVFGLDGPDVDGGAVPEDDVSFPVGRIDAPHNPIPSPEILGQKPPRRAMIFMSRY